MILFPHSVSLYTTWSSLNSVIQNVQKKMRNDSFSLFCLILHSLVQS